MTSLNVLIPRQVVPPLRVPLLGGAVFDLENATAANFNMVVFYRGLHCPLCAKYLIELARLHEDFIQRGVHPLAISSDTEERAQAMADKVNAGNLRFGHDLPLATARHWGLTLSSSRGKTSIGIEEPKLFSEPGLFLIKPDGTLYWGSTQTMPFARPHFDEILGAIDFVLKNDYPARGEYLEAV